MEDKTEPKLDKDDIRVFKMGAIEYIGYLDRAATTHEYSVRQMLILQPMVNPYTNEQHASFGCPITQPLFGDCNKRHFNAIEMVTLTKSNVIFMYIPSDMAKYLYLNALEDTADVITMPGKL